MRRLRSLRSLSPYGQKTLLLLLTISLILSFASLSTSLPALPSYPDPYQNLALKSDKKFDTANFANISQTLEARVNHIRELCGVEGNPNYKHTNGYYFDQFGISWLPLLNSGELPWKRLFVKITLPSGTYRGDYYPFELLERFRFIDNKNMILNPPLNHRNRTFFGEERGSTRFTVIRHPIARLVEHYLTTMGSQWEIRLRKKEWIMPAIIRARSNKKWISSVRRTFENQLDVFLEGRFIYDATAKNPFLSLPTFPEFIDFVLAHPDNPQWSAGSKYLDICHTDIDYFVKFENQVEEIPFLLHRLQMSPKLSEMVVDNKFVESDFNVWRKISELSEKQQSNLNKMYTTDYRYFGYKPIDFV
eukprot:sb/3466015/